MAKNANQLKQPLHNLKFFEANHQKSTNNSNSCDTDSVTDQGLSANHNYAASASNFSKNDRKLI